MIAPNLSSDGAYTPGLLDADCPPDLAEPFGVFNIFDIQAFIGLYNQGCP